MTNLLSYPSIPDAPAEPASDFQLCRGSDDHGAAATSTAVAALTPSDDDPSDAARWLLTCFDIGAAVGCWHAVAWGVMGVTGLAVRNKQYVDAARLHGAVRPHVAGVRRQTPADRMADYDTLIEALRERLGDDDFESECERGAALGWPAAVELARRLAVQRATQPPHRRRGPRNNPELTDRELDVLRELIVGRTNQSIADRLGVTAKTVMHHTGSVYRKLGVRGRAEAVAHALRLGLVG